MRMSKIWSALVAAMVVAGTHLGVTSAAELVQKPADTVRASDQVVLYNGSVDVGIIAGQMTGTALTPANHYSHGSHQSHWSHQSHQSHYSSRY